ncbi:hypothetical protein BABINDRAFT_178827 [Babjeviella inositovora NRRL Y-12698]|uniref:NADH dehydrogenase [ubiquinone] iron-sulfur protein 4, mitochondrial n=1 Tax=Babjeviella inositovora NRRL Y-12698 TaxID=984486 RepID=A0A1E3QYG6_9ASCO|nr:uncharacterized protein BABINDRAFT_178827 [Babjeviella inositovora NRRL Y-12698]ODQ82645.1 hypothetical protein BABINDRAFT_178827 [Babjeviella inositovora NRRL Y-12698]
MNSVFVRSGLRLSPSARAFTTTSAWRQVLPELTSEQNSRPKHLVSGAPVELLTKRECRIYQESKPATQSGHHNGDHWQLDWDVLGKGNRWENDVMGYQGTSDAMQCTVMKFDNKEAAIRFAEGQGWTFYVQEPKKRHFRKKDYSANFLHSAGPLKHIRTK